MNVKVSSIHDISGRFGVIKLVLPTVHEPISTVLTVDLGNPQVGGTSVKDDSEFLGRTADFQDSVILGVGVVFDCDTFRLTLSDGKLLFE